MSAGRGDIQSASTAVLQRNKKSPINDAKWAQLPISSRAKILAFLAESNGNDEGLSEPELEEIDQKDRVGGVDGESRETKGYNLQELRDLTPPLIPQMSHEPKVLEVNDTGEDHLPEILSQFDPMRDLATRGNRLTEIEEQYMRETGRQEITEEERERLREFAVQFQRNETLSQTETETRHRPLATSPATLNKDQETEAAYRQYFNQRPSSPNIEFDHGYLTPTLLRAGKAGPGGVQKEGVDVPAAFSRSPPAKSLPQGRNPFQKDFFAPVQKFCKGLMSLASPRPKTETMQPAQTYSAPQLRQVRRETDLVMPPRGPLGEAGLQPSYDQSERRDHRIPGQTMEINDQGARSPRPLEPLRKETLFARHETLQRETRREPLHVETDMFLMSERPPSREILSSRLSNVDEKRDLSGWVTAGHMSGQQMPSLIVNQTQPIMTDPVRGLNQTVTPLVKKVAFSTTVREEPLISQFSPIQERTQMGENVDQNAQFSQLLNQPQARNLSLGQGPQNYFTSPGIPAYGHLPSQVYRETMPQSSNFHKFQPQYTQPAGYNPCTRNPPIVRPTAVYPTRPELPIRSNTHNSYSALMATSGSWLGKEMKLPRFKGEADKENPAEFLNKFEKFAALFRDQSIDDTCRTFMHIALIEEAEQWFQMTRDHLPQDFTYLEFRTQFLDRYLAHDYCDRMRKALDSRTQDAGETLAKFATVIDMMYRRIGTSVTEEEKVRRVISQLNPQYNQIIGHRHFSSIYDIVMQSRVIDAQVYRQKAYVRPSYDCPDQDLRPEKKDTQMQADDKTKAQVKPDRPPQQPARTIDQRRDQRGNYSRSYKDNRGNKRPDNNNKSDTGRKEGQTESKAPAEAGKRENQGKAQDGEGYTYQKKCYYCGGTDHLRPTCPLREEHFAKNGQSPPSNE